MFQLLNIVLTTLAYTITGAQSLIQIAQLCCSYAGEDLASPQCFSSATGGVWKMTLIFGAVELALSQVRNLEEAWWVSAIGTAGSLIYSLVALIISLAHAGNKLGTVGGRPGSSAADKTFNILNSLGSIAFAYNFSLILLEIQDTMKQPPSAVGQMKKACNIAVTGSFFFYIIVAIAGYLAVGNSEFSIDRGRPWCY